MANKIVDARGRSCPEPVVMTKAALEAGSTPLEVLVDNEVAKENVTRFAQSRGYSVKVTELDEEYKLEIS
ncbi:MAG TPA: preprotein translocase subunit TatB [Clostridia bacterium]|nr:preprotein translocase subunit TatB [Clostridia bacterium]